MVIELPLENGMTREIIKQKRMLNPNAVIIVFRTAKGIPEYNKFHKLALENADKVYSRVKLFTYEHKTLSFFITVAMFVIVMSINSFKSNR